MTTAIDPHEFLKALTDRGLDYACGVPCSLLKRLYPLLEDPDGPLPYIAAVREDEAVGLAAGVSLAGGWPVVLMQNSGLGNALNAICSLSQIYRLPFLLLMTWRGFEGRDAPEHLVMGAAMESILDSIGVFAEVLDESAWEDQLNKAWEAMQGGDVRALIVKRGVFS